MKNQRIKITLSQKDYKDLARGIKDWFGLIIPVKSMKKFIDKLRKEDIYLLSDIASHDNLSNLDTMPRDGLIEFIADEIVGKHWPMGGDSKKYGESFWKLFAKKGKKLGIKFDSDIDEEK